MNDNKDIHQYDDIINLPHHQSATRPHMSNYDRAAQFSPFAALTGHDEAIKETARITDRKRENIRCLCSKCLKDYIHNPDYIVRRLDPFAKVKDHCDKCNQSGWDYVIAERQHNARGKGCQNV